MALPELARRYAIYWGAAVAAVSDRLDTAGFWDAVKASAEATGQPLPADAFTGVTALRSAAVRQREATKALAAADPSEYVNPRLAPVSVWSRDAEAMGLFPKLQATVDVTFLDPNGEEQTKPLTLMDIPFTPYMTVGEIQDQVADGIEDLVSRYGLGELVDTGNVQLSQY
jgi:hypothetical protein